MAQGRVWIGKASSLTLVETFPLPHNVAARYTPAEYIAFRYAADWKDADPLHRVIVDDSTGRFLAGYYPVGMGRAKQ